MPNLKYYEDGKPYNSLSSYYKLYFKEKTYRLSIDAGLTCPTRDNTLDYRGCIFCSKRGSGDHTFSKLQIKDQIEKQKEYISSKYTGNSYIAYFQAYTNTYADPEKLRQMWNEALSVEGIVGLTIATRPDCLSKEHLKLLEDFAGKTHLTVELGLQTTKPESVSYIRRHYENSVYLQAVKDLHDIGAKVVTHMIIGLPGESLQDMFNTANYIISAKSDGIKLQLLHILKGTDLAEDYEKDTFKTLTPEEYIDYVIKIIERLPRDMVICRLTGDGNKEDLIAPLWSGDKKHFLNILHKEFKIRQTYQGKYYNGL